MNAKKMVMVGAVAVLLAASGVMADVFGTGTNQFTLDFVPISGSTNPTSGIPAGNRFTFAGVNNDYRMGTYDITNDEWNKFTASLGVPVTGADGYPYNSYWMGTNVPVNRVSWYQAAQFVNWLNTSTGHQAAYKFTGTQGTTNYTFATWGAAVAADNGTNLYRNKDAFYYLPTEDEWVKAAYWNGMSIQTYATKAGDGLYQGSGLYGGWNYAHDFYLYGPWIVGSGSQELNGTYDMMGNVWQWTESPYVSGDYGNATGAGRSLRGGSYFSPGAFDLSSSSRLSLNSPYSAYGQGVGIGVRVASEVPEPATLSLLALGGLAMLRRRRNAV